MQKLIDSVVDAATLRVIELGVNNIVLRFQDGGSVTIGIDPNTLELVVVE